MAATTDVMRILGHLISAEHTLIKQQLQAIADTAPIIATEPQLHQLSMTELHHKLYKVLDSSFVIKALN